MGRIGLSSRRSYLFSDELFKLLSLEFTRWTRENLLDFPGGIICALLVIVPALKLEGIMALLLWTFSFAIPVFGVYLIGMVWKVNKVAAWATMIGGYAANFLCTFAPPTWWPEAIGEIFKLNVYPTTVATVILGIGLNLILKGEPGYLRQLKAAKQEESVTA